MMELCDASRLCAAFLEVLEDVSDFLPGFFGVIHGHVLAFLGAPLRVARDIFACINCRMIRNDEGLLGAIGGLHRQLLLNLSPVLHRTPPRMYLPSPPPILLN